MLATLVNKITCCWGDCHQAADNLVAHGDVILEYCSDHVDRAIYREELRREGRLGQKIPVQKK